MLQLLLLLWATVASATVYSVETMYVSGGSATAILNVTATGSVFGTGNNQQPDNAVSAFYANFTNPAVFLQLQGTALVTGPFGMPSIGSIDAQLQQWATANTTSDNYNAIVKSNVGITAINAGPRIYSAAAYALGYSTIELFTYAINANLNVSCAGYTPSAQFPQWTISAASHSNPYATCNDANPNIVYQWSFGNNVTYFTDFTASPVPVDPSQLGTFSSNAAQTSNYFLWQVPQLTVDIALTYQVPVINTVSVVENGITLTSQSISLLTHMPNSVTTLDRVFDVWMSEFLAIPSTISYVATRNSSIRIYSTVHVGTNLAYDYVPIQLYITHDAITNSGASGATCGTIFPYQSIKVASPIATTGYFNLSSSAEVVFDVAVNYTNLEATRASLSPGQSLVCQLLVQYSVFNDSTGVITGASALMPITILSGLRTAASGCVTNVQQFPSSGTFSPSQQYMRGYLEFNGGPTCALVNNASFPTTPYNMSSFSGNFSSTSVSGSRCTPQTASCVCNAPQLTVTSPYLTNFTYETYGPCTTNVYSMMFQFLPANINATAVIASLTECQKLSNPVHCQMEEGFRIPVTVSVNATAGATPFSYTFYFVSSTGIDTYSGETIDPVPFSGLNYMSFTDNVLVTLNQVQTVMGVGNSGQDIFNIITQRNSLVGITNAVSSSVNNGGATVPNNTVSGIANIWFNGLPLLPIIQDPVTSDPLAPNASSKLTEIIAIPIVFGVAVLFMASFAYANYRARSTGDYRQMIPMRKM